MKSINQFYRFSFSLFLCLQFKINAQNISTELSLSPIFSNHMVFQQKNVNPIWGKANPGANVVVEASWGESSKSKTDKNGNWMAKLKTPSYGGPYSINIKNGDNQIILNDVLIGEVWLASGQSNMEWKMNHCNGCIDNQDYEIANANYPEIRMFNVPMDLSGEKIYNQNWKIANPQNIVDFSATAYFFARELNQKMNIPIGIINSSWGGTRVEAWTSPKKLNEMNPTNHIEHLEDDNFEQTQIKYRKFNDSIIKINQKNFGFEIFKLPSDKAIVESNWHEYKLKDDDFFKLDFDDSDWKKIKSDPVFENTLFFENLYTKEYASLADGIIWFRTKFDVGNPDLEYHLIFSNGVDDFDQTYINGQNIGNTFLHLDERNYSIPLGLLKKKNNELAVRLTDWMMGGGFRGPVFLISDRDSIPLSFENFKYKHQALISNNYLMVHNYSSKEFEKKLVGGKNKILKTYNLNNPNEYSILYHRMLKPINPYGIKGVIWYQGEANVSNYKDYSVLLDGMIKDWRSLWNYDFSFYFAQIAPYIYSNTENSQGLRDAQRKVLNITPKTGMAVLLDIGEENDIHPRNKQDVGKRLALLALKRDYGFNIIDSGPLYLKHELKNGYIEVEFDHIGSGLTAKGELSGFEIAGSDGVYFPANSEIKNEKVHVHCDRVEKPINVRYGWKNFFKATLFNKENLPASSFTSEE